MTQSMPKPYDPLCFVTSIVHNTWSIAKHLHRTTKSQCFVQHFRWEGRDETYYRNTYADSWFIQNFKSAEDSLYLINKCQVCSSLDIKLLFSCFTYSTKEIYLTKHCVFSKFVLNGASLLFMFNMKAISATILSPLESTYALCVGTTLRVYKTSTWVRVYKTPLNYLL